MLEEPVYSRDDLLRHCGRSEPDLVILDKGLGNENVLDLLRHIRSRSDVPVIMITNDRCDETDRAIVLELGADDCVTKPFGLRELLARGRAALRRRGTPRLPPPPGPPPGRCRFGGV